MRQDSSESYCRTPDSFDSCTALVVLLTQQHLLSQLPQEQFPPHVFCMDTQWDELSSYPTSSPVSSALPANLTYVIYTSGSTGKPKGVQITLATISSFLLSMQRVLALTPQDRVLAIASISFDITTLEVFLPLMSGASIMLVTREVAVDGAALSSMLARSDITIMQATPATWKLLRDVGWTSSPPLKVICGGEALGSGLARFLQEQGVEVWNMYGPTETTVWSTVERITEVGGNVSIGRPI